VKIVLFSDVHAGGPAEDWMAYVDKRWVGVFNYRFRRRFQHDLKMLERAVEFIFRESPDLVVCCGDLTSTGQPGEFRKCLSILEPLRNSAIPMVFAVGNHDYYVHWPRCVRAMREVFAHLNTAFAVSFEDLPAKRTFHGIDLFLINTSWPSNLLSSHGVMRRNTRNFLLTECAAPSKNPRILIGHYPIIEDHPLLRIRHRLYGEKEVRNLLVSRKIDLSLCGHIHRPYTKLDASGRGEICAGSVTRNGCLSVIEHIPSENRFDCRSVRLDPDPNR
jgi:predicted MPP superfamily phosphohydrolase